MKCKVEISHGSETKVFAVRKGLGFQALAAKHQTPIEFDCRKSDCGVCLFKVAKGADNLTAPTLAEEDYLKSMAADGTERLACQANIIGDVSIEVLSHTFSQPQGLTLSKEAAEMALKLQEDTPNYRDLSLRLYLDGKGCDGFTYGVTFDKSEAADIHFDQNGVDVIVDPDTLQFTDGSHIVWVDDDRGRGFLVENPSQKSFRGKFFKQAAWQHKLTPQAEQAESGI